MKKSFLFDRMLGKLCRKMRLLGYDCKLNPESEIGRFLLNAMKEERVAVTRSTRHHDRPGHQPVILSSKDTHQQIVELFQKINEPMQPEPFTLCMECNAILEDTSLSEVSDRVPEYVKNHFTEFKRCPGCSRIYWKGSHYEDMLDEVEKIKSLFQKK
jgi:uncharacterized protein with PIN domain